jgi:hypothetical protein
MLELTREEPCKDRLTAFPEVTDVDKHSSLLGNTINYGRKEFYITSYGVNVIKTGFLPRLGTGKIS